MTVGWTCISLSLTRVCGQWRIHTMSVLAQVCLHVQILAKRSQEMLSQSVSLDLSQIQKNKCIFGSFSDPKYLLLILSRFSSPHKWNNIVAIVIIVFFVSLSDTYPLLLVLPLLSTVPTKMKCVRLRTRWVWVVMWKGAWRLYWLEDPDLLPQR